MSLYLCAAIYNLNLSDIHPKVVVGVRLRLGRVLNLTSSTRSRWQPWLRLDELLAEDWREINDLGFETQSQAFGRAAHDLGTEALVVPSARVAGGVNLVYFPESVLGQGKVQVLGQDELQRWLKKG